MRHLRYLLFSFALLFLFALSCEAQTTSLTLTVTDAGGQSWNNGTWSVLLVSAPGSVPAGPPFYQTGTSTPVPNQSQSGLLSTTGTASITLTQTAGITPIGTRWSFTVCGQTSAINNCFTQAVVITASTTLTLTPPALIVSPGVNSTAYVDAEISGAVIGSSYYNVTLKSQRICGAPAPCTWGSTTSPPTTTVAGLPSAASSTNSIYQVTDAVTQGNCVTGGGSFNALCRSNGVAWSGIGDGGSSPTSGATINPLAPKYSGVADQVTLAPIDLSGGGTTLVSSGLFTASLVGKVGTCLLNNDFGSFGGVLFTVTGFTDTSHITVSVTITRAFAGQACSFATSNFRTALQLAQADVPNGGTLQLPCGNGILYSGGQIFSSFPLVPSGGIVNIAGCSQKGTTIVTDYSSVNTNTTAMMITPVGVTVFLHDIIFQNVGYQNSITFNTGAASSLNSLFVLSAGHAENIETNGWAAGSYTGAGAGFTIAADGGTWRNICSGAGLGVRVFDRSGGIIVQDGGGCSTPTPLIVEGQEDDNMFVGGNYSKITINSNAGPNTTTLSFVGVNSSGGTSGQPAVTINNATAPMYINWLNGRVGSSGNGVTGTNITGFSIGTNVQLQTCNVRIDSSGTGFSVNNSGNWREICPSYSALQGAGWYTGAGTVNGKTTLSGTAYVNATTTFTNLVGGSGQTFQWNVQPNQFLNLSCHIYYQAAATGGLNVEFTGPAAPIFVTYGLDDPSSPTAFNSAVATAYSTSLGQAVGTAATNYDATVSFSLQNGTTGGTVNLLAKSSAAVANGLTIQPGSNCQSQ